MDHQNNTIGFGSGNEGSRTPTASQDSGYSSQPPSIFSFKKEKRIFEKEIPASAKICLDDWKVLFGTKLYQHVIKETKSQANIAIKPRYIGTSEDDSKLCALFVCNKEAVKSVKSFLRRSNVRELLEVKFRIQIIGGLNLVREDAVDVHLDLCSAYVNPTASLCGLPIVANVHDQSSSGTLGGVLMVTTSRKMLYGMTAGHVVNIPSTLQAQDLLDSQNSAEDACDYPCFMNFESENCSDDDDQDDDMILGPEDFADISIDEDPPFATRPSTQLGTIATHIEKSQPQIRNHDWDLVELPREKYLPNVLQNFAKIAEDLDLVAPRATQLSSPKDVTVISSRSGLPKGVLRQANSSMIIGPGENFVDTLDLTLHNHRKLRPGDSGSWVVNYQTGEVYGHVVAIDIFGDSYVMPMQATLDDMKMHLGALDVSLPSQEDIIGWVADHQAPDLSDKEEWQDISHYGDNSSASTSENHSLVSSLQHDHNSQVPDHEESSNDMEHERETMSATEGHFACPFYRYNPVRHWRCYNRKYKMREFSDVKTHIERQHALQEYHCPRCAKRWKRDCKEYQTHIDECCKVEEVSEDHLSSEELSTLSDISSRHRGLTDEQRWMLMWKELFSAYPEPVSPFQGTYLTEITNACRERNKGELQGYIEKALESFKRTGQPPTLRELDRMCTEIQDVVYKVPLPQVRRRRKPIIDSSMTNRSTSFAK
ncbi:unnamed protein product [Clonostachys rosea]|uniref:C2H2-type domain-containing protein n=1 Tax=Bionectria ochroleuca TaxID=29856 RepID=A0ABY6V302_BIOOC|nr:unnamed protein product [Clonostachys rosea]